MSANQSAKTKTTGKTRSLFRLGGIEFDPSLNPCVLDTLTWDAGAALAWVFAKSAPTENIVRALCRAGLKQDVGKLKRALSAYAKGDFQVSPDSCVVKNGQVYFLSQLRDGQKVFLNVFESSPSSSNDQCALPILGELRFNNDAGDGRVCVRVCPINVDSMAKFVKSVAPQFSPKPLGTTPRLGIGNRQTIAVWPGIIKAISELDLPCEIVQNSAYRELAPMSFILQPPSAEAT